MAEKKQVDLGEFDLDDLFGPDGMDNFNIDPPAKKRAPIEQVTGVAISAGKSLVKDRSFIRSVLKNALPKGYAQTYDAVDTAQRNTRNLYNEAMSEIRPGLREVKRATNALLPRFEKSVPPAIAKYLKKFASEGDDDDRAFSADRARRESMDYDLKDIFEAQAEIDSYNTEKQSVEKAIFDKKAQNRHQIETELLSQINISNRRLVGYQDNILAKYHRKSLELQYLQYYSLVDLLETTRTSNKSIVRNLADIVHNSALPDFLKLKTSEAGRQWIREKTFGKLSENYGDWASEFGGKLLKNASGAVMRKAGAAGQGLSEAAQSARAAAMASQFMSEEDKQKAKERTAGEALATVGRAGAARLGSWAGKYAKRIPGVNKLGSDLEYVTNNWQNMASDWSRSQTDLLRPGGFLIQAIKDAIPGYEGSKTTVRNDGARGEFESAPWSGGDHRSLTEIIPGFLSRILQSTEGIRTGRKQDRLVYNYDRSDFTTYRENKRDVFDRIVGNQGKFFSQGVDDLVGQIDENGELDKDARDVLRRQLFMDVGRGGSGFSPRRYAKADAFGEADEKVAKRLAEFIQKAYGVSPETEEPGGDYMYDIFGEEEGVLAGSKRRVRSAVKGARGYFQGNDPQREKRNKDVKLFNELRTYAPEIGELLSSYANSGQREILRDLGLLKKRGTADVVDNDFLWRYLGEQDASTSSLKEEKYGERRPESNRSRRRVRSGYVGPGPGVVRGADVPGTDAVSQTGGQEVREEAHRGQFGRVVEPTSIEDSIDRLIMAIRESSGKELLSEISQISAQILLKLDEGVGAGGDASATGPVNKRRLFRRGLTGLMKGAMWGAKKYVNLSLLPLKGARWLADKTLGNAARWGAKRVRGDWKEKATDVFVNGELTPRIRKAQIESGELIDVLSKKPIHAFKDITGPVKDSEGNDVLTEEDFRKGLRDGRGRTLAGKFLSLMGKGARNGLKVGWAGFKLQFLPLTLGWKAAKGAFKLSRTFFDVYVPGDPNPRLRANLLRAGNYLSATTQKPITKYSDIDGPVVDRDGNVVLSLEDVSKGLVDRWGKPIGGLGKKLLVGGTKLLWKGAKMAGKGALAALKYGGMLAASPLILAGKLAGKIGGGLGLGNLFGGGKNETLEKIYTLLQERMPQRRGKVRGDASGDGVRDNSWSEIVRQRKEKWTAWNEKRKAAKAERDAAKGKKKEGDGILGKLMMMFGGVMSMMKNMLSPLGSLVKILGTGFADVLGLLGKGKFLKAAGSVLTTGASAGGAVLGGAAKVAGGAGRLAMGAGRLAIGVGGWALRALPMLATPWGAGIAAVAAVGYGGYKAYRYMRERMGLLGELRMLQHGVDPADDTKVDAIRELEAHLVEHTTFGANGEVKVDQKKIDFDAVAEAFGVTDGNQETLSNFGFWYRERFLPVYTGNLTALRRVDTKLALPEIDRVDDKLKYKLATAISAAVGGKPLTVVTSPFASDRNPLLTGSDRITAKIEEIKAKYGSDETQSGWSRSKGALNDDGTIRPLGTAATSVNARKKAVEEAKTPGAMSFVDQAIANREKEKAIKSGKFVWNDAQNRTIDELTSIRMRTYGLIDLDILDVGVLQGLEEAVAEKITFGFFGGAEFKGEIGDFYNRFGANFGCNPSNAEEQTVWKYWFEYRFLPVMLNFMSALHKADRQATVLNAWSLLKFRDQVQVAQAIVSTNTEIDGREVSVWSIDASPFPGKLSNVDARSTDDAMASLKSKIKEDKLNESKFRDAKKDADRESKRTWMEKQATSGGGTQYGASRPMGDASSFGLGGGASGMGGGGNYGPPPTPSGGDTGPVDFGREVHPGKGSGGDINSLPVPKGDGYNNVKDLILSVAQMTGVDPSLLMMMCAVESDFKITATPGTSNAAGLFQFVPKTWRAMLKTYGGKYGIGPETSPMDPRANALMGAEYVKENYQQLARKLGRTPTENDIYLAHFLGASGSTQVLKGNPNDIAARLNPSAAQSNPTIFYDNGRPRTVRELIAKVNDNIRKKIAHYGIAANETAKTGKDVAVTDAPKAPNVELQPTTELGSMGPKPVAGSDWGADTKPTLEADPTASTNVAADTAAARAAGVPAALDPSSAKKEKPTTPPTTTPVLETGTSPSTPIVDPSVTPLKDRNEDRKVRANNESLERQQRVAAAREQELMKTRSMEAAEDKELLRKQSESLVSIDTTLKELLKVAKSQNTDQASKGAPQAPSSIRRRSEIAPESRQIPVPMGRN